MRTESSNNPWRDVVNSAVNVIAEATSLETEAVESALEVPPDPSLGDIATTVAFLLAKKLKKNPAVIAKDVGTRLQSLLVSRPLFSRVEVSGPYINLFVDRGVLTELTIGAVTALQNRYGHTDTFKGNRALIESPAVNPSKPWHIGHARNAIIGDSLANILEATGYEVLRIDYINNLGLQIAQVAWKLRRTKKKKGKQKYDHYLGKLYVEVQAEYEGDKTVEEGVRQISRELEDPSSEMSAFAEKMVSECVRAQNQTSYRLGIYHDYQIWESVIAHSGLLESAKQELLRHDFISMPQEGDKAGCIVANLETIEEFREMKETQKILFRSDGTRTYTGADLVFQMWKFGITKDPFQYELFEMQPNGKPVYRSVLRGERHDLGQFDYVFNVIASGQAHPQKLIYTLLALMGYKKQSENSRHIAYEFVGLEETAFSGRKGTWLGHTCDEVLDKAEELAREEVAKRNPDEDDEFKARVAREVAVGALRYFMLKASPERKITFRWGEVLDFDGDTGPYLQYSYARAQRILERAEGETLPMPDFRAISSEAEFSLVKAIARFPDEVLEVVRGMRQSVWGTSFTSNRIAAYCNGLATLFSKFYDTCPVLKAEPHVAAARLELVKAFKTTMANCMALLGIPVVDRM
ncbi:MAG: arginine--tRNA ligase [Candidatus Thorarchaeota archaeon]|nr:arginine--tRNA ligase [Candidatus Thorarchaeota archaeon]